MLRHMYTANTLRDGTADRSTCSIESTCTGDIRKFSWPHAEVKNVWSYAHFQHTSYTPLEHHYISKQNQTLAASDSYRFTSRSSLTVHLISILDSRLSPLFSVHAVPGFGQRLCSRRFADLSEKQRVSVLNKCCPNLQHDIVRKQDSQY
jgi:hypothetical protein